MPASNDHHPINPAQQQDGAQQPLSDNISSAGQTEDEQMAALRKENKTLLEQLRRERADFINFRARMDAEKTAWMQMGQNDMILAVLPLIEAWERAIAHMPEEMKQNEWAAGVLQIQPLITSWMQRSHVEKITTMETPFDPALHDAILQAPGERDSIVAELEAGYRRHDKVLKPAKVVLGTGEKDEKPTGGQREMKSKKVDQNGQKSVEGNV